MYPVLQNCLIRGSIGDYYLQHYLHGAEYKLTNSQALILHACDGTNTMQDLMVRFSSTYDVLSRFFHTLLNASLLVFADEMKPIHPPPLATNAHLQEVQIEGTGKCNLWCKHCYGREQFLENAKNDMTLKEFALLCAQMEDANVARAFLSGGEIMTRRDVPELIKYVAKHRVHLSGIFTNGTICRTDVFDTLRETGMKTSILVSLDGHLPHIHEYVRGEGTFKKCIDFIEFARSYGHRVTVNTVATKQNVSHLLAMRQFMEDIGVSRWRVSVQREQGEAIRNSADIAPEWDEVFSAYEKVIEYILANPNVKPLVQLSSVFKTEFLQTGRYYLYRDSNSTCEYKRNSLVVTSQGMVIPCPAGMDNVLGSIEETPLFDIWNTERAQLLKTLPISKTACSECEIRTYCGSGCRVIAMQNHGNYLEKDINSCALYSFFAEKIRPILSEAGVKGVYLDESPSFKYTEALTAL